MEFGRNIMCLIESKVSGKKANCITNKLGFNFSHRVKTIGFPRGIWMG